MWSRGSLRSQLLVLAVGGALLPAVALAIVLAVDSVPVVWVLAAAAAGFALVGLAIAIVAERRVAEFTMTLAAAAQALAERHPPHASTLRSR
jgi:hypothetical protein